MYYDNSLTVTPAAGRDKARTTAGPCAPVLAAETVRQTECQQETSESRGSEYLNRTLFTEAGRTERSEGITVENHQVNRREDRGGHGIRYSAQVPLPS